MKRGVLYISYDNVSRNCVENYTNLQNCHVSSNHRSKVNISLEVRYHSPCLVRSDMLVLFLRDYSLIMGEASIDMESYQPYLGHCVCRKPSDLAWDLLASKIMSNVNISFTCPEEK